MVRTRSGNPQVTLEYPHVVEGDKSRITGGSGSSRAEQLVPAVGWWRDRYQGSTAQHLITGLGEAEFGNWIILFGATFLLSVLPLIILLNVLANSRVDDDIATRLGLNREGAHLIDSLFSQHMPA